jgi:heptosyltransferase III
MRQKSKSSAGARVAIIRLRSLGDCVLTTPALSILKHARPDLKLAVVVEDRFAPIFQGNPDIDEILPPDLTAIARWRPELALNLHGGPKSAQLTVASRAPQRAGFAHFRFQSIYNIRIPRAQEILGVERKVHTVEHLASAMFYLGVPSCDIPRARLFATAPPKSDPYAVIHPCASAPDKTWPAAKFRELARSLPLEPVFIAGPGESLAEFDGYRTIVGASLEEIKNLLAGATLFIGNDSGPAHMAAAFGLPVVVLFGASDPEIWGPWKTESSVLTSESGIAEIESAHVFAAISTLATQPTR